MAGLRSRVFSSARVRRTFSAVGASTKFEIALAVAAQFPELEHHKPRYRKPWMSEDHHMAFFDAVALALTYFDTLPQLAASRLFDSRIAKCRHQSRCEF
jgi:hypothetical protein